MHDKSAASTETTQLEMESRSWTGLPLWASAVPARNCICVGQTEVFYMGLPGDCIRITRFVICLGRQNCRMSSRIQKDFEPRLFCFSCHTARFILVVLLCLPRPASEPSRLAARSAAEPLLDQALPACGRRSMFLPGRDAGGFSVRAIIVI